MSRGSDKVLAGYSTALTQRVTELTDWHRNIPRNYSSTSPRARWQESTGCQQCYSR